jgi:alkylation response protein AidB-like acyl-CoA dehydrogenase
VPYTDALGVARVEGETPDAGRESAPPGSFDVWVAASTGYVAGLGEEALRLAVEHARSRRAFGGPLSALEPVQQMLADAATLVDGLTLLTADRPGVDALAHAGDAAERAVAICMQVTGALGFTMEFPLQRAYRRSRSARSWNDAVLDAWDR